MGTFSNFLVQFQEALTPHRHRDEEERKELTDKRLKNHVITDREDKTRHVHMQCRRTLVHLVQQMELLPQVSLKQMHIALCVLCLRVQVSE